MLRIPKRTGQRIQMGGGAMLAVLFAAGLFGLFSFSIFMPHEVQVLPGADMDAGVLAGSVSSTLVLAVPLPEKPRPLADPPKEVRGIYITSWVAGTKSRIEPLKAFLDSTDLDAAVVDIKDYSGYVAYRTGLRQFKDTGAEKQIRIGDIEKLIRELHDKNIYVLARVSVFQDPVLAKAHPEWALKDARTGRIWLDHKGLAWMDPASREVWDYNLALAKNALDLGFDEINFDYIRFPSDGETADIVYPAWDKVRPKRDVLREFFSYVREELKGALISADIFGQVTVDAGDPGIGQVLEDVYPYFDFVSPMVYPSHYRTGFRGYKNPAQYPYEVIKYSMDRALARRETLLASSTVPLGELRPWLQAFDLGATYDRRMIDLEIQAVADSFRSASTSAEWAGWLLWDPNNRYQGYKN